MADYAAERAAAGEARETLLISDDDLVARVAAAPSPLTLVQLAAALNTMDSRGLLMQLQRLAKATKRRPARVWRYRDRWYVKEAK